MIHSFSCKNFYSFGDLTTVDFVVNDNAPQNNGYFTVSSGTRLSKVETVIGPNASGKTNLLKVLPFLKWLIVDSFAMNPAASLPVRPFAFAGRHNKPIELSVIFEINGDVYAYAFTLRTEKIISETMRLTSKLKQKTSSKMLFSRVWNEKDQQYRFKDNGFHFPKGFDKLLRSNSSMIGAAMRLNHQKSEMIAQFWQQMKTNVSDVGWATDYFSFSEDGKLIQALDFYNDNKILKREAEKLLSRFDLGLETFDIKKEKQENGFSIHAQATHMFGGQKKDLPLFYESSGTKQLLILLKDVLQVLGRGGFVVIDEFDLKLHPDMIMALCDLFIPFETNPHNAQILFSTHNHRILSTLDKYQIVLVEKNEKGMSESWRLDEMDGVRADDNYYSKYIAGAYGAVPKL